MSFYRLSNELEHSTFDKLFHHIPTVNLWTELMIPESWHAFSESCPYKNFHFCESVQKLTFEIKFHTSKPLLLEKSLF